MAAKSILRGKNWVFDPGDLPQVEFTPPIPLSHFKIDFFTIWNEFLGEKNFLSAIQRLTLKTLHANQIEILNFKQKLSAETCWVGVHCFILTTTVRILILLLFCPQRVFFARFFFIPPTYTHTLALASLTSPQPEVFLSAPANTNRFWFF